MASMYPCRLSCNQGNFFTGCGRFISVPENFTFCKPIMLRLLEFLIQNFHCPIHIDEVSIFSNLG